jgi:hypothetical protein
MNRIIREGTYRNKLGRDASNNTRGTPLAGTNEAGMHRIIHEGHPLAGTNEAGMHQIIHE